MDYEQLEFDTRSDIEVAVTQIVGTAVEEMGKCIERNCINSNDSVTPLTIKNRFEAYGVAAEQAARILAASKKVKPDLEALLVTLAHPNLSAVEAIASLCNTITTASKVIIQAAATMERTMKHLYNSESGIYKSLPLEGDEGTDYQEVEPLEADEEESEEE